MNTKERIPFPLRRADFVRRVRKNKMAFVLLFPFLSLFIIFTVVPVFMALFYSLTY